MVDAAHTDVVAILTRAPSAGGKTRLFAELGRACDPALLRALLLDTLDGADSAAFTRVIVVAPRSACDEVAQLAPGIRIIPQAEGSLGDRMRAAMGTLLGAGASRVAVIGSDLPEISAAPLTAAFALLRREPDALVLGPAGDGGYYLIAASRVPPVFDGVAWGSPSVLAETSRLAHQAGVTVHLVDPLDDVDGADDLVRVMGGRGRGRTAAWARKFVPEGRQDG